jgi:hypothetical protein
MNRWQLSVSALVTLVNLTTSQAAGEAPLATPTTLPFERVLPGTVTEYEILRAGSGRGNEYILCTARLAEGGLQMRCTRGRSGAEDKPWLLLRHHQSRKGLALALADAGNWTLQVESTPDGKTRARASTLPENLPVFETISGSTYVPSIPS